MPELLIVTTTYKRPEAIRRLQDTIQYDGGYKWFIWDDGSPEGMYEGFREQLPSWATYQRSTKNRGKRGYWKTVDLIFKQIRVFEWNYCLFVPDDAVFVKEGVRRAVNDLGSRNILSLHNDQPERLKMINWGYLPKDEGTHWSNGFVDMLFIARKRWFDKISWRVKPIYRDWERYPDLGSGVGAQLTRMSYQRKEPIHIGKRSYIYRDHNKVSVMNPERR